MNFTNMMAALDGAVEDHLCDDAVLAPHLGGGTTIPVRVIVTFPTEIDRLQGMAISRSRPTVSISHATAPNLREGDTFSIVEDEWWRVASAPTRPGDGRWWQAEIEPYA